LQGELTRVHLKWKKIQHDIDSRTHQEILKKTATTALSTKEDYQNRITKRTFGYGGTVDLLQHRIYQDGAIKLKHDIWANKAEKLEWLEFVNSLTPDELAIVQDTDFK
jgi:hypothetical protein